LNRQCSGITGKGTRCTRSVEGPNGLCWLHDPTRSEDRKRAASKGGKARPNRELQNIKDRLSTLAEGVLEGTVDKGKAAVAGQVLNTYIRAVSVELKVREQEELAHEIEELRGALEVRKESKWRYGSS
jgi:hypothetical protein